MTDNRFVLEENRGKASFAGLISNKLNTGTLSTRLSHTSSAGAARGLRTRSSR